MGQGVLFIPEYIRASRALQIAALCNEILNPLGMPSCQQPEVEECLQPALLVTYRVMKALELAKNYHSHRYGIAGCFLQTKIHKTLFPALLIPVGCIS